MVTKDNWLLETRLNAHALNKWQKHVELIARIFQVHCCMVLQNQRQGLQVLASAGLNKKYRDTGSIIPWNSRTLHRQVLDECRELYIPNAHEQMYWEGYQEITGEGMSSYLGLPLVWPSGVPFGLLVLMHPFATDYHEPYFELIHNFKEQLEADLQLIISQQEMNEMALLDEMTGIYNRRGFNTLAEYKLSVAKRYGHMFGLMYFDLDNLQLINNQFGHNTGDQAIIAVANALNGELRDCDVAARIGNDEFAALVFIQEEGDLENLAIRIQKRVNIIKQQRDSLPPLTTSVGAKCYKASTDMDITTMLNEVDQIMFSIKHEKKLYNDAGYSQTH